MGEYRPTVNLSVDVLVYGCSLRDMTNDKHYEAFNLFNRKSISDAFRYKKFQYDFADYLTCYNDGSNIIGIIKPCYEEFIEAIAKLLNLKIPKPIIDDEYLTIALNQKINELKKVKTEKELREKFPWIYNDLIEGRRYMYKTKKLFEKEPLNHKICEERRHYFYSCGMRQRLDNFIESQAEVYQRFVNNRQAYKTLLEQKDYNKYIRNHFDLNKVAMYVIHEYLVKCESTSDLEGVKNYLSYIEKYLDSNYDKNVMVKVDKEKIDFENIIKRYQRQKNRLTEKVGLVDWIIIPNSQGKYNRVTRKDKPRKLLVDAEKLEKLKAHGRRKEEFYDSTDYVAEIVGILSHKGYVGYLYENGEIIFDREYISYHPSTATGNAIYNLRIYDFETLSKLDKAKLKDHPKAKKIVHSKKWEERVNKIISREPTEQEAEDVKKFIKRYQK